jgi:hypothetical protein
MTLGFDGKDRAHKAFKLALEMLSVADLINGVRVIDYQKSDT